MRFVRSLSVLEARAAQVGLAIFAPALGVLVLSLLQLSLATLVMPVALAGGRGAFAINVPRDWRASGAGRRRSLARPIQLA